MAAKDSKGQEFVVGQHIKVKSKGPTPWSLHEAGDYEGTVVGVHEDGPHVLVGEGADAIRIAPFASECEIG